MTLIRIQLLLLTCSQHSRGGPYERWIRSAAGAHKSNAGVEQRRYFRRKLVRRGAIVNGSVYKFWQARVRLTPDGEARGGAQSPADLDRGRNSNPAVRAD